MSIRFAEISYEQRKAADVLLVQGGAVPVGGWKFNNTGALRTSTDEILLGNIRDISKQSGKNAHKTILTTKFPDARDDMTGKDPIKGDKPNNFDGFKPPSAN